MRFDTESDTCGYIEFSRRVQKDPLVKFGERTSTLRQKLQHKCLGVIFDGGVYFSEHITHVKAKAWRAYHAMRRMVGDPMVRQHASGSASLGGTLAGGAGVCVYGRLSLDFWSTPSLHTQMENSKIRPLPLKWKTNCTH